MVQIIMPVKQQYIIRQMRQYFRMTYCQICPNRSFDTCCLEEIVDIDNVLKQKLSFAEAIGSS